jgi:hypothetical protein
VEVVRAPEVVDRDHAGDGGVEHALRHLVPGLVQHRVGVHVVADIAHEHEAAPMQAHLAAGRAAIDPVRVEPALDGAAALLQARRERAVHEPEPVAVDQHLVLGVHRRDANPPGP